MSDNELRGRIESAFTVGLRSGSIVDIIAVAERLGLSLEKTAFLFENQDDLTPEMQTALKEAVEDAKRDVRRRLDMLSKVEAEEL